jgi:hypothetical protein
MRGCGLESFEVYARYVNPVRPGSADSLSQVQDLEKESPPSNFGLVRCYGPSRDAGIHKRKISILQIRRAG